MVRMSLNMRKVFLTTFIVVIRSQYAIQVSYIFVLENSRIFNQGGLNHCKDREENRTWCNIIFKPEIKKSFENCFGCWLLCLVFETLGEVFNGITMPEVMPLVLTWMGFVPMNNF